MVLMSDRDLTAVLRVVKSGRAKASLVQQHLRYTTFILKVNQDHNIDKRFSLMFKVALDAFLIKDDF